MFASALATAIPPLIGAGYSLFQQKKQWEREDTAYSRAINDMRSAGVNPQLFTGSSAPTGQPFRATSVAEKSMQRAQMQAALAGIGKIKEESNLLREQALTEEWKRNLYGSQGNLADSKAFQARIDTVIKRASGPALVSAARSVAKLNASQAEIASVRAKIASRFAMPQAEFDLMIKEVAANIAEETGLPQAQAELLALGLANDVTRGDAEYNTQVGLPPGGTKGVWGALLAPVQHVYNIILGLRSGKWKAPVIGDHPDRR